MVVPLPAAPNPRKREHRPAGFYSFFAIRVCMPSARRQGSYPLVAFSAGTEVSEFR